MTKENIAIGLAILALVVGFGGWFGGETVERIVEKTPFGAIDPNFATPYLQWGGVQTHRGSMTVNTASSTLCAIQAPATGTSTLRVGTLRLEVSTTSASVITFAKSATAFATTTNITSKALAANAKASFAVNATTTLENDAATTFAPSQWLVVSMQGGDIGGTATNLAPEGKCTASFDVLN